MATASAHIKHLRQSQNKEGTSTRAQDLELSERKGRKHNPFQLMQQTVRYEKYSKYWSILSNVAAIVSVSSAIYVVFKKSSRWF